MMTEIIDKLFLELSQFTTAKTARELQLESLCKKLVIVCEIAKEELPRVCRCDDRSCQACMALDEVFAAEAYYEEYIEKKEDKVSTI